MTKLCDINPWLRPVSVMIHTYIQPSAHLRDYIKEYKLLHFRFGPHDPGPMKPFTASPNQGISFYPRGFLTAHDPVIYTRRLQTVIFGQHVSRLNLRLCQGEFMLFDNHTQAGRYDVHSARCEPCIRLREQSARQHYGRFLSATRSATTPLRFAGERCAGQIHT